MDTFFLFLFVLITSKEINAVWYKDSVKKFLVSTGKNRQNTVENLESDEDLAFPGYDKEALKKIQQLWENYYSCLDKQENRTLKPEMHRILEGQFIELKCNICPKPFLNYEEIEWKYKTLTPEPNITELEHLDLTPKMEFTSRKNLQIFNALEYLSGLYVCYYDKSLISVHILEVTKNDTMEKVQASSLRDELVMNIKDVIFLIHYKLSPWTECSLCGNVGQSFRYGTCYVSHKIKKILEIGSTVDKSKRSLPVTINPSSIIDFFKKLKIKDQVKSSENENETVETEEENVDRLKELAEKFEDGVPCFSSYVSDLNLKSIQRHAGIKVAVKRCLVKCEESEIFEVYDKFGKIVEIANNSAGIYSAFQKIPQLPPDLERQSLAADFGKEIVIQCPSTRHQNIPITWKINRKIIFPEVIANESNQRFTIDLVNRIHIKKLRLKDNQIYSCWQRDKLVGTVHLNVEKKFLIGFDHHVTLVGMLVIIGTFLLVGLKIITRELKNRKKQ